MTAVLDTPVPHRSVEGSLAGLGEIVRLVLRRDRWLLLAFVVLLPLIGAGLAAGSAAAYPTEADRIATAVEIAANPALLATRGPVFAPTPGGLVAQGFAASGSLIASVVSLLLVVRHTRADEQAGRRELLGSTVVGRHASLAAALVVVGAANLALAVLTAVLLTASGLPAAGSIALGLVFAAIGIVFACVGAAAAQVAEGAGAARGLALVVLAASFAVSGAGEVTRSGLVWWSPFGWTKHVRSYAGEQWWVFVLFAALAVAMAVVAFAISARRDIGAGLVAPRLGPAAGAPSLRSPLALAWRMHRGALLGWAVGFTLIGALIGAAMRSIGGLLDAPSYRDLAANLGTGDPSALFFGLLLYILTQVASAFVVSSLLQVGAEESGGLADLLLSGPVARTRWALAHLLVTVAGIVVVLAGFGLAAGIGYGTPVAVFGATMAYLPACLLFAGLALALFGWAPRLAAPVTWALLGIAIAVDFLREFGVIDTAVLSRVSPFAAIATPLGVDPAGLAWAQLTVGVVAVGLAGVGLLGLRRRDLSAA